MGSVPQESLGSALAAGGNWLNLYTDNQPVEGGVLGQWDTELYPQGDYSFRLVVYDASGAFAEPCTIPITVGGVP